MPDCADYQLEQITPLIEGPVRAGDVKLAFHHFSFSARETTRSAYAAVAAGEQGRQWQYIQLFYINLDEARERGVTDELLERIASGGPRAGPGAMAGGPRKRRGRRGGRRRRRPGRAAQAARAARGGREGPSQSRELVEAPSLAEIEAAIQAVGG